jgi:hypothetical protein
MTKKKLNTQAVINELRDQSAFFKSVPQPAPPTEKPLEKKDKAKAKDTTPKTPSKPPSNHGSTTPRNRDTTVSRYHDTVIEAIRRVVKEIGKEAATHRFTEEEKKRLADLIYTYKNRGIKTSENEITRIAVNYVISNFEENGENSLLHRALKALNG